MSISNLKNPLELNPKQPEFVLITSGYEKKIVMKHNLAHFYQFCNTESDKMTIIPDACVDILFWKKDGQVKTKIAGTRFERGYSGLEPETEYFGIRFMPGVNPLKGAINLSELANNEECFEDLITSCDERKQLLEGMFFSDSFEDKIKTFMNYYMHHYDTQSMDKNSLNHILYHKILHSGGSLKLSELSNFTGYSERYLNKKIHEEFGMNPKNLVKIIRFQKAVGHLTETIQNINCMDTALEFGYYDQSHFNKEFKKFTGLTPIHYANNLLYNSYDTKLHVLH